MGYDHAVANVLMPALRGRENSRILDMGSGAGGIMPEVLNTLRARGRDFAGVQMSLSDRFPNRDAIASIKALGIDGLEYLERPVDATDLTAAPEGVKTMVNSFHHLRPEQARAVLESAHAVKTPILVFELVDNRLPFFVWVLALPLGFAITLLMSLFMTPFVRPLTFRQFLFSYLIPLVPLVYAWDGQASYPRIYGPADVDELTAGLDEGYTWESGHGENHRGQRTGFYLLGMPADAGDAHRAA